MAALCDCRHSASGARSKQAEYRRLATAPAASPLRPAARAEEPWHPGPRPARALARLGGRLSAAARQHSSNRLHQLLRADLLRLAAAPAGCTAAGSRRSAREAPYRLGLTGPSRETPRSLSLTGGAATKTALSQRCGVPPPLCRPCHGISSLNRFTRSDSACPAARHPNRFGLDVSNLARAAEVHRMPRPLSGECDFGQERGMPDTPEDSYCVPMPGIKTNRRQSARSPQEPAASVHAVGAGQPGRTNSETRGPTWLR
jgi:hypothetical protein